jgi:hypothetical protein
MPAVPAPVSYDYSKDKTHYQEYASYPMKKSFSIWRFLFKFVGLSFL